MILRLLSQASSWNNHATLFYLGAPIFITTDMPKKASKRKNAACNEGVLVAMLSMYSRIDESGRSVLFRRPEISLEEAHFVRQSHLLRVRCSVDTLYFSEQPTSSDEGPAFVFMPACEGAPQGWYRVVVHAHAKSKEAREAIGRCFRASGAQADDDVQHLSAEDALRIIEEDRRFPAAKRAVPEPKRAAPRDDSDEDAYVFDFGEDEL